MKTIKLFFAIVLLMAVDANASVRTGEKAAKAEGATDL